MKRVEKSYFQLRSFWLALGVPVVFAVVAAFFILGDTDLIFIPTSVGLAFAVDIFIVPMVILAMFIPLVALVMANHRNEQVVYQIKAKREQNAFTNHYLHVEQFSTHMGSELLKRLGISPRVLHTLFYPHSRAGDFTVNNNLLKFMHFKFLEVVQAAQVVEQLYRSLDEDEKAVAQNRLEFTITQSVALMYFFAEQVRGQQPECMDFYFLKDAMADYFDLVSEVTNFDGISDEAYDLTVFRRLFEVQDIKAWFNRSDHFLRCLCEDNQQENLLHQELANWQ